MDRPHRRRGRTPSPYGSPVNLRGVEENAERGAVGGGKRFVYHHHHYHHHHSRRPSPSLSPPRYRRRSSPHPFRYFSRERRRPSSRDSVPRRQPQRWASPIPSLRPVAPIAHRNSPPPAGSPLPSDGRAVIDRPTSPQLPPIVVRRNRSPPPQVPLQVRPASVSSIASSFLFPRPISPAQLRSLLLP